MKQREEFSLDRTIAGLLRHFNDPHVIVMTLPEKMLVESEEFPGQPPYPVPRNYPFDLSLNHHAEPFSGILIATLEKEEMVCSGTLAPCCPFEPPPVQPLVFRECL